MGLYWHALDLTHESSLGLVWVAHGDSSNREIREDGTGAARQYNLINNSTRLHAYALVHLGAPA